MANEKKRKYDLVTEVRIPDFDSIVAAASDFTEPTDTKTSIGVAENVRKNSASAKKMTKEQQSLQRLGIAVAEDEAKKRKLYEEERANQLRELAKEREAKRLADEAAKAEEEKNKPISSDQTPSVDETEEKKPVDEVVIQNEFGTMTIDTPTEIDDTDAPKIEVSQEEKKLIDEAGPAPVFVPAIDTQDDNGNDSTTAVSKSYLDF